MCLPPLGHVEGLNDAGRIADEGDGARDVVDDRYLAHLFPRHRHVLQQLDHRVRHPLQGTQVHAFVVPKLSKQQTHSSVKAI